ncbi:DUF4362 domain-containing protein [Bacillus niameyensis]|uniref:DUF4362 domain-containing protein n=1 Tax=Bacillus niameyensis TaxID=1522308 RepID=UPI0007833433|nr:DUF4362 domain-containing protein [Bacillus niameyensis]
MQKTIKIGLLFLFLFTLAACNSVENKENGSKVLAIDTPKPTVKGVKDVDVVNTHGSIEGLENIQNFYDNMQKGVSSDLRIVHYTTEGDPIISDLTYDGNSLEVKYDTTRDNFGAGGITTKRCTDLVEEVNLANTSYIAIGCDNKSFQMDEILTIDYNMRQQDRFEFRLNYGDNLENEVASNTNMQRSESNQYNLIEAESVQQEVYKKLVFANYLAEKNLVTKCGSDEARKYNLLVHINGGQREFEWSDCDQSRDGAKFTAIAEYMIEQAQKNQQEQEDIIVQGYVLKIKDDTLLIGEGLTMFDYEWLKDEMEDIDFDAYMIDFTMLDGVHTEDFREGDKIEATIDGKITNFQPGKATVKEIKKLDLPNG